MNAEYAAQLRDARQQSAAHRWREGVAAKGASYFNSKPTPEQRIERMKSLYVAGEIDHTAFEMSVSAALGLPLIALGSRFSERAV